jgi:NCS1 family nucleobase:cation symporter-1
LAANSLSAGADLTALFPRFISIRRGGYICALVGVVMNPWILESSSSKFESYLSGFSVFLSSIAGVLISHYYVVAKQRIAVDDLYTNEKGSMYRYTFGVNLRAYAAYLAGVAINVVGFASVVRPVPLPALRLYQLSWFTGFLVSAIVYIGLNYVFPARQPTVEEAETVTVGREHRESTDMMSYDDDEKSMGTPKEQQGRGEVVAA